MITLLTSMDCLSAHLLALSLAVTHRRDLKVLFIEEIAGACAGARFVYLYARKLL